MLVPVSWLRDYVAIDHSTPDAIGALAEQLTLAGLEVGGISQVGDWWDPETIRVGQVVAVLPHPDADRLVLVDVEFGGEGPLRVVTGAPNLFVYRGQSLDAGTLPVLRVAFAMAGAELVDAYSDANPRPRKRLKPSKIRGVESSGMVCSERELGLSEEHEGIILLPEDAPVGTPLRDYLGDSVLEVDLTPDMARCLHMIGVAREIAALRDQEICTPPDQVETAGDDRVEDALAIRIDAPELCHRYTGTLIRDVQMGDAPAWMQDRLRKAGVRPISNVVDITNYVMFEWGQPLHAFDYDVLVERARRSGADKPTIIVRRAEAGEKFTTLDGVERTLDSDMLLIADTAGAIAVAGVMGGLETEVTGKTTNVLLESATFEGINNRRTAQKLRLPSEASYRFARGVPAELNALAARRAADLLRQLAGGRVVPGMVDAYPVPQTTPVVYTTLSDVQRLLGIELTLDQIEAALAKLDIETRRVTEIDSNASDEATFALHHVAGETLLACTPPWYRLDVRIPADIAEEVARMVGYDQVGTTLLDEEMPVMHANPVLATEEKIRDILVQCGLYENISRTLTTPEQHVRLRLADEHTQFVTVANPITPERSVMRRTLLVSALENLARNLRYTPRVGVFEVGRVYLPEQPQGDLPTEERRVSVLLCGPREPESFYTPESEEMDFFDLKGVVETLVERLGFKPAAVEFRAAPNTGAFGPRCAELVIDGAAVGLLGEIHPNVAAAFGLAQRRVCVAELQILPLVRPAWSRDPMPPISVYPPVVEDLAFVVEEQVTARQVQDALLAVGKGLVADIALFDVYRGDALPANHKSLAFRLTYQSLDHSLTEKEVNQLRNRLAGNVERVLGGRLRSS